MLFNKIKNKQIYLIIFVLILTMFTFSVWAQTDDTTPPAEDTPTPPAEDTPTPPAEDTPTPPAEDTPTPPAEDTPTPPTTPAPKDKPETPKDKPEAKTAPTASETEKTTEKSTKENTSKEKIAGKKEKKELKKVEKKAKNGLKIVEGKPYFEDGRVPYGDKWPFRLNFYTGPITIGQGQDNSKTKKMYGKFAFELAVGSKWEEFEFALYTPLYLDLEKSETFNYHYWGNTKEWDFDGWEDTVHDILTKIRILRFGHWEDRLDTGLFFQMGRLEGVEFGHGFLLSNYNNSPFYPLDSNFGLILYAEAEAGGIEIFASNIDPENTFQNSIYGFRFILRFLTAVPVPVLKKFGIGASVLGDLSPREGEDKAVYSEDKKTVILTGDPTVYYTTADVELPVLYKEDFPDVPVRLKLYLDVSKMGYSGDVNGYNRKIFTDDFKLVRSPNYGLMVGMESQTEKEIKKLREEREQFASSRYKARSNKSYRLTKTKELYKNECKLSNGKWGALNGCKGIWLEDRVNFIRYQYGKFKIQRDAFETILLNDGKVLIIGGLSAPVKTSKKRSMRLNTIELYDPNTGEVSIVGKMKYPRVDPKSILLNNGKILIVGGINSDNKNYYNTAELFDLTTGKSEFITPVVNSEYTIWRKDILLDTGFYELTILKDGKVLLLGLAGSIYDPETNKFYPIEKTGVL